MYSIYGQNIGNTIDFRSAGKHQAVHPWPEETAVSAGNGIVFRRGSNESYRTLFMEVYPPGASFIRGEGETFQECEDSAWAQYLKALHCPANKNGSHEWIPKSYRNGAGLCRHCSTFKPKVFTGEQLGQFCEKCGIGTTYYWKTRADGTQHFFCQDHTPPRGSEPEPWDAFFNPE